MEVLFENRYTMSKKRFHDWAKHPVKRPIKKNVFFIMWLGIMIVTIYMSIISIMNNDVEYFAFYLFMTAFCSYRCFFRDKMLLSKQFKVIAINQGKEEWERVIQFTNSIMITDGNTTTEYQWSQIKELINDKDYLILVLQNDLGIRLDKSGFEIGTVNSFIEFISREYQGIPITTRN